MYVKPKPGDHLADLGRTRSDPMACQLEAKLRKLAKTRFDEGHIEIDDNAPVSMGDTHAGAEVQAWVWTDKQGDHRCSTCTAEWFDFELQRPPTIPPTPDGTETPSSGVCPACGGPCSPTTH